MLKISAYETFPGDGVGDGVGEGDEVGVGLGDLEGLGDLGGFVGLGVGEGAPPFWKELIYAFNPATTTVTIKIRANRAPLPILKHPSIYH